MRRTSFAAFATLLALAASSAAHAQDQGTIYYAVSGNLYAVGGGGSNARSLPSAPPFGVPSGRADYPTGRLFLARPQVGTIPGSPTNAGYADVYAHDLAGNRVLVTNFRGPLWVPSYVPVKWSNDGQDTFLSLVLFDAEADIYYLCRAHVTGADIASPGFIPLTIGDPRLETVLVSPDRGKVNPAWDAAGSKFAYGSSGAVRIHTVASGTSPDNDPVIYDSALTGYTAGSLHYSPTSDQLVAQGIAVNGGYGGVIAINAVTGAWAWLARESQKGLTLLGAAQFSPDGTGVTFCGQTPTTKGKSAPAVLKCPANGGTVSTVTLFPTNSGTTATGWLIAGWRW